MAILARCDPCAHFGGRGARRTMISPTVNLSWLPPVFARASDGGRHFRRIRRGSHGVARRDGAQPLRQDRLHHQPDPQPPERAAQPEPHAASRYGRRAAADRRHPGNRQCASVAAVSLFRQYRGDGGTRAGWPIRTIDISEIGIDIRFTPANPLGEAAWAPHRRRRRQLTLRIVDYPGEWLLDLPLWSRASPSGRARPCSRCAAAAEQQSPTIS